MKIAFFLDNKHLKNIDFSDPENGNPGTGAGTYLHVAIPYFLKRYHASDIEVVILAVSTEGLPHAISSVSVKDIRDAAKKAKDLGVDFFIFRPRLDEEDGILDYIDTIKLHSIGRAALTPKPAHIRKMAKSKFFKALVCVGREQYDFLVDTSLQRKLAYIDNGIHFKSFWNDNTEIVNKNHKSVVYMGALVPMKGFHLLAEAWPKVLKRHPDAKLSVIGSVKMYGDKNKVGPLGVADRSYEQNHIIPYLCNEKTGLHSSVTFHGQLGKEKIDILKTALVGCPNPSGQTETCCVSAVEMAACKTAVVSGAYYALLDTVWHKKTGLLGRGIDSLANNICALLDNPQYARELGEAGYQRIKNQYDFKVTSRKWILLFDQLKSNEKIKIEGHFRNYQYHFKMLRLINSVFQKTLGAVIYWPSIYDVQTKLSQWVRAVK